MDNNGLVGGLEHGFYMFSFFSWNFMILTKSIIFQDGFFNHQADNESNGNNSYGFPDDHLMDNDYDVNLMGLS